MRATNYIGEFALELVLLNPAIASTLSLTNPHIGC